MKKINKKLLTTFIPMCIALLLIILLYAGYVLFFKEEPPSFLETIESSTYARIDNYAIYGIHMNIEGQITLEDNIEEIKLVLSNGKEEVELPSTFENTQTSYTFKTSEYINEGITLETLPQGELYFLIKTTQSDNNNNKITKYYSVENKSKYQNLEYYTLTKNHQNNKINIEWNTEEICPTLKFTIKDTSLPEDVYDITIDPGHDAVDSGCGKRTPAGSGDALRK